MVSRPASTVERQGEAPSVARMLRWTLPLALVAIGFLVAVTFRARPAPGLHGESLGVTAALVVFAAALVGFERVPARRHGFRLSLVWVMVTCAAALFAIQPDGTGYLMVFPPIAAAAFRFPRRTAATVAGVALLGLAMAATFGRDRSLNSVIVDELAVAAYFGVSTFAGRFIIADEHSRQLITQLERTRVAEAQTAALAERQRLAREMHDVLAHTLSGLVLNLEGARLMGQRGVTGPDLEAVLTRSHSLAKTGLGEARHAIGMLRDDALLGPGRLAALAVEFEEDSGVRCRFSLQGGERDLSSDCNLTLYRTTQEALTNIRKHARPNSVEVVLSYEPDGIRLVVEDHGNAERPSPRGGNGYGLTGMRERAELLGGELTATATHDGFRVELWAPA